MGYGFFDHVLTQYSVAYNKYDKQRQLYIIKNIIKSIVLGYLSFLNVESYSMILHNKWDNTTAYKYASNFVANDFMGLLLISKLPFNTKLHHITSVLLYIYMVHQDFNENHTAKLILTYGAFSAIPFMVNLYLGIRYIIDTDRLYYLRTLSNYTYKISCILNISTHAYIIMINHHYTLSCVLYIICLIPIINDDLILIKWLENKKIKNT
jgi:hypothetical protein